MLSDTDRDNMRENHEFFTRMTSVPDVLLRLVSRGVMSEDVKQKLIRMPNAAGSELILRNSILLPA